MKIVTIDDMPALGSKQVVLKREGQDLELELLPVMSETVLLATELMEVPVPPMVEGDGGVKELDYADPNYNRLMNVYKYNQGVMLVCHALGKDFFGTEDTLEQMKKALKFFTADEMNVLAEKASAGMTPSEEETQEAKDTIAPFE